MFVLSWHVQKACGGGNGRECRDDNGVVGEDKRVTVRRREVSEENCGGWVRIEWKFVLKNN